MERIAKFIADTTYEQLPEPAIDVAKRSILDCLGVTLAGCDHDTSKIINDHVKEEAGKPEAGVIGGGYKTSAALAAWANGTKAHALDYDDVSLPVHPTAALLPAALAIGEKFRLSGKEVLLGYIIGFETEMSLRFGGQHHVEQGWHVTSSWGTIGAAAAVAKMLALNESTTRMALGIAASSAGGLRKNFGTMTKPLHAGNAARNGVVAAMLARRGFTADDNIFGGSLGFLKVFGGEAEPNNNERDSVLGTDFYIVSHRIGLKPYPSCAGTHWAIQAALDLKRKHSINPADVAEVECRTSSGMPQILIHHRPKTALEGKFSLEFCVAISLLDGEVTLKQFTDDKVRNPLVQDLIKRVKFIHPPEMGSSVGTLNGEVVVKLRDGKAHSCKVDIARGDPRNPLGWDEVRSKYKDCAHQALSTKDTEHSLALILDLDSVADITELMHILTFRGDGL